MGRKRTSTMNGYQKKATQEKKSWTIGPAKRRAKKGGELPPNLKPDFRSHCWEQKRHGEPIIPHRGANLLDGVKEYRPPTVKKEEPTGAGFETGRTRYKETQRRKGLGQAGQNAGDGQTRSPKTGPVWGGKKKKRKPNGEKGCLPGSSSGAKKD